MASDKSVLLMAEAGILSFCTIVCVYIQLDRHVTHRLGIDASRWFLLIGACLALAMSGMVISMATKGLGRPMATEDFMGDLQLQRLELAAFVPYFLCNMFIKLSWLTFFYGLACSRAQNMFIHVMQFIATAFGLSSVAVILTALGLTYHPAALTGHGPEVNVLAFFYCNATIMILSDSVMYLLPIWLLRNNSVIRRNQMGIYVLFAMGGIIVVASVLRLVAVFEYANTDNPSGAVAMIWFWAAVENHLGICIACAGAIKQKYILSVRKLRESWSSRPSFTISRSRSKHGSSGSNGSNGSNGSTGSRSGIRKPLEVFKSSSLTVISVPVDTNIELSTASTCAEDFSPRSTQSKCWFEGGEVAVLLDEDRHLRCNAHTNA